MRRDRRWWVALAAATVLVSGCASQTGDQARDGGASGGGAARASTQHGHYDHHHGAMSGMDMSGDGEMSGMDMSEAGPGPSAPARMICGDEIRHAVRESLKLTRTPTPTSTWAGGVFSCTYDVPPGRLVLSVDDATDVRQGRAHFDALRSKLDVPQRIVGVQSFGLPSYEDGANVVFLRDGKTLRVDASGLPRRVKPYGFTRSHVAYAVAASVVACWTE